MTDDTPTMAVDGFTRKLRSEADRLALVAEFERWGGTQVGFCEAKGVSTKTLRSWRRRYGSAAAATAGRPPARESARPLRQRDRPRRAGRRPARRLARGTEVGARDGAEVAMPRGGNGLRLRKFLAPGALRILNIAACSD
ncbi:MAG: hypothetical protein OXJ64_05125, partial [Boseongicola sp.]|nr:hypothetical protein [Boseongicola sp.]